MSNVLPFPNTKPSAVYVVEVVHDEDMWVGSCDALHCCTEAPTYEELMARFWEVAPDIASENGIPFDANVRIDFVQATAIAPEALLQA